MKLESVDPPTLRALCDVLADTHGGLTNRELTQLLDELCIDDPNRPEPRSASRPFYKVGPNKRDRLYAALSERQRRDRCGNLVGAFIEAAMHPVRYAGHSALFDARRRDLNVVLAFAGLHLGKDGRLRRDDRAATLEDAARVAHDLRRLLADRGTHGSVLRYASEELVRNGYFHAVFEATKGLFERLREMTGLSTDGHGLVDQALGLGSGLPLLAFNPLQTESDRTEHRGMMNLFRGAYSAYRSPKSHSPRATRNISEQEAVSAFGVLSELHRLLDSAVSVPRGSVRGE